MPGVILQQFLPRLRLEVRKAPHDRKTKRPPRAKKQAAQTFIDFPIHDHSIEYALKPSPPKK